MNLQNTVIAAILVACATSIAPAQGADKLSGQMIKAYKAGRYESAEQLGEKLVAKHPYDYSARYYLANTYVLLHKNEQAMGQYRTCLNSGVPGQLQQYSSTALERLLKQKEQALMSASQSSAQKDKEIKEFQKKIRQETKQEEVRLRAEWNQALSRLDDNYGGRRGYGRRFGYENERYRVNDSYSKRMAELSSHEASMLSQANCGTGNIRLAPSLSSSKVKNYVNYGNESDGAEIPVDNPLHAQARSLSDVAPKAAKPTASHKAHKAARPTKSGTGKTFRASSAAAKTAVPGAGKIAP
jgi:hypothetical protein